MDYNTIVNVSFVPLIFALIAIAFPLLLQSISRIDDKYSSTNLVKIFYKDIICKLYLISLALSILSVVIWFFALPRIWNFGHINKFVDNSAFQIIGFCTLFEVVNLFLLVSLINIFYIPSKLLEYLIKKHNGLKSKDRLLFFNSISDLLYFSIQNPNEKIARRLLEFLNQNFYSFRANNEYKIIKYPSEYYDALFEANEQLCLRKRKTISYYNNSTLLNLLFDDYQKTILSEESYTALWICIRQALEHQREDIVMSYWEKAHQHFNLFMKIIYEKRNNELEIINKEVVLNRKNERERFLEFHYALGGLLMYLKKYNLLIRIMAYTNQTPAKYVLVPETLSEVITKYMSIKDPITNPFLFESRYSFPDISGINKGDVIEMWIRKYCAVLFLRQYTLSKYHLGSNIFKLPNIPNSLGEMDEWKNELEGLKKDIEELIDDREILNKVGFGHLTNEWFMANDKLKPSVLIQELIDKTKAKYNEKKETQVISKAKEKDFNEQTKDIVLSAIESYREIENQNEIENESRSYYINGVYQLMDKAGFSDDQDISYINADSVVAQSVVINMHYQLTDTFSNYIFKKYILNAEDIFPAIKKLDLNFTDYCILAFNFNLSLFKDDLEVQNLTKVGDDYYFCDIKIINFDIYVNDTVRNSIIILKKSDLPQIKFNPAEESEIEKYKLKELDESTHLSASILDLNSRKDLRDEISKSDTEKLTKNVLVCISIGLEVIWRITSKCYQFKLYEQFIDRENPTELKDIESIN